MPCQKPIRSPGPDIQRLAQTLLCVISLGGITLANADISGIPHGIEGNLTICQYQKNADQGIVSLCTHTQPLTLDGLTPDEHQALKDSTQLRLSRTFTPAGVNVRIDFYNANSTLQLRVLPSLPAPGRVLPKMWFEIEHTTPTSPPTIKLFNQNGPRALIAINQPYEYQIRSKRWLLRATQAVRARPLSPQGEAQEGTEWIVNWRLIPR